MTPTPPTDPRRTPTGTGKSADESARFEGGPGPEEIRFWINPKGDTLPLGLDC